MNFHIDVVSLNGKVFSGEAKEITIPTLEGVVSVLARHMPYVAPLTVGEVVLHKDGGDMVFSIGKGIFSIAQNSATLLIEDATMSDEVNEEKAEEARKKAVELIAKGITKEEKLEATYALRKSLVDLKIARRRHKTAMQ
jgi:F-type H+-transporting ATPase subunit epsilon